MSDAQAGQEAAPVDGGQAGQVAGGLPWLQGADADLASYVTQKGFKDPVALAKSYKEAEAQLSTREIRVPDKADTVGWSRLHKALGVPESADKYDFGEAGKAMKPEAVKVWSSRMHELGVPAEQAKALVGLVSAEAQALREAEERAFSEQTAQQFERVKLKWGESFDKHSDLCKRGWSKLGVGDEQMDKLLKAFGAEQFMELSLQIGRSVAEAGFVSSDGQHRGMSVAQAQSELQAMRNDQAIANALTNPNDKDHARYKAKWSQLLEITRGQ